MANDILQVDSLYKSFDGYVVISGISLAVPEGELSAIIGPNGAGKTTLFNLITGYHLPSGGSILFRGREIAGMQPFDIVKFGIARAFQRTNIFPRLTVLDNIVAAMVTHQKRNINMVTPLRKMKTIYEKAYELLESVGLIGMAHQTSGTLAHGNQKRLDIAVALALEPKLLLLDEPTAGMSPEERWQIVELIQRLWKVLNITMLFIEHDMDVVFKIAQKVRVLSYGVMLAEGTPEEISKNKKVIEAYLGEEI
jgi:branched-chain amino acid transport system ATP-binding protein